jgi:hypothetical protein
MNWILAGLIAVAALGIGYIGSEYQKGQQAQVDLQKAQKAADDLADALVVAKTEVDALRVEYATIITDYEDSQRENASRANASRTTVRTVVQNTPTLAAGRVPADFVRLFNDIRSPRDITGSGSSAAGSIDPATVPARAPDAGERRR